MFVNEDSTILGQASIKNINIYMIKLSLNSLTDANVSVKLGPFGKAPAPASLALDPDPREELILLILLEN
jgi:hypothetical protein